MIEDYGIFEDDIRRLGVPETLVTQALHCARTEASHQDGFLRDLAYRLSTEELQQYDSPRTVGLDVVQDVVENPERILNNNMADPHEYNLAESLYNHR